MDAADIVGWTPEPQTRGTIGLVWSCVATILLCTWNVVHPNLPSQNESALRILWRRIVYLFVALVAPEFMCFTALEELFHAIMVRQWMRDVPELETWSLTQCFYLKMGGIVINVNDEYISLKPEGFSRLVRAGAFPQLEIKERDIMDHSKADWVLKSLALAQVIWFVTQIIGRAAEGLSVTTLELFTLGIISCALGTYGSWWAKPFDVRRPTVLELKEPLGPEDRHVGRVGLLINDTRTLDSNMPVILAVLITVLFGALHLVGWRFHFPTVVEMWLWRGTSAASVTMPLIIIGLAHPRLAIGDWISQILAGIYTLCRLYMMVEMFAGLRSLPSDVYKTPQWSQYFPAFG